MARMLSRRDLGARFLPGSLMWLLSRGRPASAAPAATTIKRLVVVTIPEGPNPRNWSGGKQPFLLTGAWCPAGPAGQFPLTVDNLSPILGGFRNLVSDTLVLDGLANSAFARSTLNIDPHPRAMANLGPGTRDGRGSSVDQVIAPTLKRGLAHLRESVQLGIGARRWGFAKRNGAVLTGLGSPSDAFARLFQSLPTTTTPSRARLSETERGRLLVDRYLDDYRELRALVGAEERARLDANVESLAELQKRLESQGTGGGPQCERKGLDALGTNLGGSGMDVAARPQMEIVANLFACDITRTITVQMGHAYADNINYPWLGINTPHHGLAHQFGSNQASRLAALTKIYRWYFDQVAFLAARLKATPDPDGGTLLDHTAIVTLSEFGDGHHMADHLAVVLVGGSAAGVRSGRVVRYTSRFGEGQAPGDCQPLNRLYLTLCRDLARMELGVVGDAEFCAQGPLDRLRS